MKLDEKISSLMEDFTPKQLLMMAGAAGILTFAILYWSLTALIGKKEEPAQPQEPAVKMVKVVQAKADIKARSQITENMVRIVEVPESVIPDGALTEVQGLSGRTARVAIMSGDILTERKIYRDIRSAGFTGIIPPECRAMSIAVNDVTGVSGFMKPGDYVDVMLVAERMDNTRITGEVILQNVLLLGVNNMTDRAEDQGPGKNDSKDKQSQQGDSASKPLTATLAVRPEQELRLAVAAKAGQIYLALRPYKPKDMYMLDTEYSFLKGRAAQNAAPSNPPASQRASSVPQPSYPAPSAGSSDPGSQMEIIRGTRTSRGQ